MNRRTLATTLGLLTVTGAAAFLTGRALATGAPTQTPLTYGGVVTDKDGKPYPSAQDVSLAFYDKADATVPKCTAPTVQAEAGTGRFSVVLPPECAQAVHDAPDLWTEAAVGAGKTVLPRTQVGAVPYALEADAAKVAGAAGGGLKTQLDGLASDVAGLKAAPAGGSGGPWVVDAKGVKVGRFVQHFTDAPTDAVVQTSAGYLVRIQMLTGQISTHPTYEPVFFSGAGCAGKAYLSGSGVRLNAIAVRTNDGKWYVADGAVGGVSSAVAFTEASSYDTTCYNQSFPGQAIPAHEATLAEMGLANLTPPFGIAP